MKTDLYTIRSGITQHGLGIATIFFTLIFALLNFSHAEQDIRQTKRNTMKLKADDIMALVHRFNAPELERRKDYYNYLCEREPQTETLEQHIEQYAQIIRVGDRANADDIHTLENVMKTQFPEELKEFYSQIGKLKGREWLQIFSVQELQHKFHSEACWEKIASLGLVDMIKASWGNDRSEFEPTNGCLTQAEVEALNQNYTCIGWICDGSGEANHYIYFDRTGKFGTAFYHQDDFDAFYQNDLVPMLESSKANQTFSEIVVDVFRRLGID